MSEGVECPECGKGGFANQKGMRVHHARVHGESLAKNPYSHRREGELECPSCGEDGFAGWAGLNIHHSTVHGEKVQQPPNTACHHCGSEYHTPPSKLENNQRTFCSEECRRNWLSDEMSSDVVHVACANCEEEMQIRPSRANRCENHFCSWDCVADFRQGENHPQWNGGEIQTTCAQCGNKLSIRQSRYEENKRCFCSYDCRAQWESENRVGPAHHQWEGGTPPYGEGWNERKREAVRERQDRRCAGCGVHQDSCQHRLSVHHIQKAKAFEDPQQRNALENLVALCQECHAEWERFAPLRPQTPYLDG